MIYIILIMILLISFFNFVYLLILYSELKIHRESILRTRAIAERFWEYKTGKELKWKR